MAEQAGLAWPAFSAQHPGHGVDAFGVRQQVSGESSRGLERLPCQKRCAGEGPARPRLCPPVPPTHWQAFIRVVVMRCRS